MCLVINYCLGSSFHRPQGVFVQRLWVEGQPVVSRAHEFEKSTNVRCTNHRRKHGFENLTIYVYKGRHLGLHPQVGKRCGRTYALTLSPQGRGEGIGTPNDRRHRETD
jgi:hypothetical protein